MNNKLKRINHVRMNIAMMFCFILSIVMTPIHGLSASNPFALDAAETVGGRYESADGKIRLHIKPKDGAFVGTLQLNEKDYSINAEIKDDQFAGRFGSETESWPFSVVGDGKKLSFKSDADTCALVRKPFAFKPGTYQSEKVWIRLEATNSVYSGILKFKGKAYPSTARMVADELDGTANMGDDGFPFTITNIGAAGELLFACGPFRDTLGATEPVQGEVKTSSATGMEFVWVSALKLWVGKYEVTNGEYRKKDAEHDSKDYKEQSLNGDRQPVVRVNFYDAVAYAAWLTERDKSQLGGLHYRVPSETEWLTFAQCDDGREYPWGNSIPPKYGNYSDSASADSPKINDYTDGYAVTCPVEKSGVNDWGLYGVGGNVCEVCASDVSGSSFGAWRGASWNRYDPVLLRCAFRFDVDGATRVSGSGFRLVLSR